MTPPDSPAGQALDPGRPETEDAGPLRAAHTPNFPGLLRQLGASLLVTTYQAGKLVMVRLLRFESGAQEVFAVPVLPGRRYPDLINEDEKLLENSFTVPDAALADVPASLRALVEPTRAAPAGSGSATRTHS